MKGIFGRCTLVLVALLTVACNTATPLSPEEEPSESLMSIAQLKTLAESTTTPLTEACVIEGVVTANDAYGELHERLIIEDQSGAIGVAIEGSALHRTYPVGTQLVVRCTALALCNYGRKVELGAGSREGYTTPLNEQQCKAHLRIKQTATAWPQPLKIRIRELNPSLIDRYVRLEEVQFVVGDRWCATDPATALPITTEHTLIDSDGETLTVRTLGSVHYASEPLPEGKGSLHGVIDYFGGRYSLRVVNHEFYF